MLRQFAIGITALALTCALAPAAASSPTASVDPVSRANPSISREVTSALPPLVRASSVVIDPTITADTVIVYPDGTLVPGQSAAKTVRAASSCGVFVFVRGVNTSTCAVFGSPGLKMKYTWNATGRPTPVGCVAGEGHDDVGRVKWLSAGCGTSGRTTIPWGNNLAKPRLKASSGNLLFAGGWSHASVASSAKCKVEIFVMPPSRTKNAGRVKCPNVFTSMRAKVKAGSTTKYGKYVGANAWSTVVFSPGATVRSVTPVK